MQQLIFSALYEKKNVNKRKFLIHRRRRMSYPLFALYAEQRISTRENLHTVRKFSKFISGNFLKRYWGKWMRISIFLHTEQNIVDFTLFLCTLCRPSTELFHTGSGLINVRDHFWIYNRSLSELHKSLP